MIIPHYSEVSLGANFWPWKSFSPLEMACRHCGELYYCPETMDRLQEARGILGAPMTINCGHRCAVHNAHVGGAPLSQHKKLAADISVRRTAPRALLDACQKAGFTTFGFYGAFLHTDTRPGRRWITTAGRQTWNFLGT